MKIIAADHSGTYCNLEGIGSRWAAEDFAKSLQNMYEYDEEPPDCPEVENFLNGKVDEAECTVGSVKKDTIDGDVVYRVYASWESEEYDDEPYCSDCIVSVESCVDDETDIMVRGSRMTIDDLYKKFK